MTEFIYLDNFMYIIQEKIKLQLEKEVRELILQRDIFESQVKDLSKMVGDTGSSITQVNTSRCLIMLIITS